MDASNFAWRGSLISLVSADTSNYWTNEEQSWDIATKEATALERVLLAFQNQFRNSRVDALVHNQALVQAWNNQSGKSGPLNKALKRLFFTTVELNVSLHLSYISTNITLRILILAACLPWIASCVLPYERLLSKNLEALLVTPAI